MDGSPNRRNKATFSNFSAVVWTSSKCIDFFFVVCILYNHYKKGYMACKALLLSDTFG